MAEATKDFEELLDSLRRHEVRFVVVGAHAIAGRHRDLADLEILKQMRQ